MEHSAQQLAERALAGDGDALGLLWASHRSWVAAVVLSVLGEGVHLEDTLQEVALAVARDFRKLESPEAVRPWLRAVARNVAVGSLRRRRRDRRRATGLHGCARDAADDRAATGTHPGGDDLAEMMRLVGALPEEYREPLLLRATRGMPIPVIAEILGLTPAAVETRLRRARAMLRDAGIAREMKGASR